MSLAVAVFGAGVIATVYGGLLAEAGDDVTLLARGSRLTDLQRAGLILENADTGAAAFNACRCATGLATSIPTWCWSRFVASNSPAQRRR